MITVKTTSGNFMMDSFLDAPVKAADILSEARVLYPGGTFEVVRSDSYDRYAEHENVPDGETVYAMSEQPVDA